MMLKYILINFVVNYLILFELCTYTPAFIISEGVSIFLEQCVDPWYASIPGIFQIFEGQTSVR